MSGAVVRLAQDRVAAMARIAAAEPFSVDGATAAEMCAGCALFDVFDGRGRLVGSIAGDFDGPVFRLTGAAGVPGMLAPGMEALEALEKAARLVGVQTVEFLTIRPGLVGLAIKAGYTATMQKKVL